MMGEKSVLAYENRFLIPKGIVSDWRDMLLTSKGCRMNFPTQSNRLKYVSSNSADETIFLCLTIASC